MKDMILIIEDDKDIAAIEKDYMEINGYGGLYQAACDFLHKQEHHDKGYYTEYVISEIFHLFLSLMIN